MAVQTLDIFAHRFGDEAHPGNLKADEGNTLGEAGLRMLDAIQTVVDVLADDVNKGYSVGFTDTVSAYTEHGKKRITISGLPLVGATKGTPYREIAAVLTGFAVHEVGHTKRIGIIDAVRKEWPGKKLPATLGNIIEDVVLEARTIERYAGFKHVFEPTFEWVAETTCPKSAIKYSGTSGHKVNFVGQVVRYRHFVTFSPDALTQQELLWWDEWAARINAKTDGPKAVELVREALLHIAEPEPETEPEPGEGEPEPGEGEDGEDGQPGGSRDGLPDEEPEDDDTEGDDGDGESDEDGGSEGGDTEGDSDEDGESNGGTEGDDDGQPGGSDDGGTEGGDEDGGRSGDGLDADTEHRLDGDKGSTDSDGAGGSGQTVAEASDDDGSDPDDFREEDLDKSFDDMAEANTYSDRVLDRAIAEERTTTRLDAGAHGKMRVIFR